jgi:hypothetical protein
VSKNCSSIPLLLYDLSNLSALCVLLSYSQRHNIIIQYNILQMLKVKIIRLLCLHHIFYFVRNGIKAMVIGSSLYKGFFYRRYCPFIHFLITSLVAIMPIKVLNHRLDNRINKINAVDVDNPTP